MLLRHLHVVVLTGAALCGSVTPAAAQFRVMPSATGPTEATYRPANSVGIGYGYHSYPVAGYSGYPYGTGDPYGGYMNGAASAITAQGQYYINTQQAYLIKEQVRQAQMDNHRRAYDEWLYERANTPTLNDERERVQREETRRARSMPPQTEIWAGTALNTLLFDIQQMQARGCSGPIVPLNEDALRQINVSGGNGQGNQGLLKDAGRLNWPLALETLPQEKEAADLRMRIDQTLLKAKDEAASGRVSPKSILELQKDVKRLRDMLFNQVNVVSFSEYTDAKRFLSQIDAAVTVLTQPNAGSYVNGTYSARGKTVKELVQYMTDNGLRFAAAVAGDEAAYNSVYHALLTYDVQECSTMTSQGPQK